MSRHVVLGTARPEIVELGSTDDRPIFAFSVRGIPKGQPRGRATIRGRHAGIYDPGTANGWKALVANAGSSHRPAEPIRHPVRVVISFAMPRPKRLMRRSDPDGPIWCTAKPDVDNLTKAVLDALTNDGWWLDDSIVAQCDATKRYHAKNDAPGAVIAIMEAA